MYYIFKALYNFQKFYLKIMTKLDISVTTTTTTTF